MINTIVVMAAGKGTRMLELSQNQPKHLIGVKNKPFLYYLLKNIKEAGYNNIILVVGYKKEKMEDFKKEYSDEFNLKLIDQFENVGTDRYGTACPVEAVKTELGKENFVVINGDDLYATEDLENFRQLDDNYNYVAGYRDEHPEYYGLLKHDENNYLEKIIEKPKPGIEFDDKHPLDSEVNIGMYKFTTEIFQAIDNLEKSPRGEYELPSALEILAKEKKVKVKAISGYWLSFGKPDDVAKIEKFLDKK